MSRSTIITTVAVAVVLFALLALLGGRTNSVDSGLVVALAAQRSYQPALTQAALALTFFGGATATLVLAFTAAALLVARGSWRRAGELLAIILSGRIAVESLKLAFARPRPAFEVHPVIVHSASFPSAHAANSMIVFVTIALFLAPVGKRSAALAVAVGTSLAVGATRPLLGVHWPSDVLAGWLLGLIWAVGWQSNCALPADRLGRS